MLFRHLPSSSIPPYISICTWCVHSSDKCPLFRLFTLNVFTQCLCVSEATFLPPHLTYTFECIHVCFHAFLTCFRVFQTSFRYRYSTIRCAKTCFIHMWEMTHSQDSKRQRFYTRPYSAIPHCTLHDFTSQGSIAIFGHVVTSHVLSSGCPYIYT